MEILLGVVAALLVAVLGVLLTRGRRPEPGITTDEQHELRQELAALRTKLDERSERLDLREERLTEMTISLQRDRDRVAEQRLEVGAAQADLKLLNEQATAELERIAGISAAQARAELVAAVEETARIKAQERARQITDDAVTEAERIARQVVTSSIERIAVDVTAEAVVSSVDVPSEEMKGRIIGREGRNIRAFEQTTGVSLVVDDTPGVVLLSCFDPVRREIARQALVELIADGRIDPSRVEQAHQQATENVDRSCLAAAEDAIHELGLRGIDRGLLPTIGALQLRTSYGQNVLEHSVECARLAGAIAAELGLDVETCRRAAFLHDLGKAIITHGEGSHAAEGAELAKKYGQAPEVVHAIAAHHNEIEAYSPVDVLTQAVDAISSSRPGARRESIEAYVKRLERLEQIALRTAGVERAYAMRAGREVRVMVVPDQVDDERCQDLARQIADDVAAELVYPGRIKVTVIRESRVTEFAH